MRVAATEMPFSLALGWTEQVSSWRPESRPCFLLWLLPTCGTSVRPARLSNSHGCWPRTGNICRETCGPAAHVNLRSTADLAAAELRRETALHDLGLPLRFAMERET